MAEKSSVDALTMRCPECRQPYKHSRPRTVGCVDVYECGTECVGILPVSVSDKCLAIKLKAENNALQQQLRELLQPFEFDKPERIVSAVIGMACQTEGRTVLRYTAHLERLLYNIRQEATGLLPGVKLAQLANGGEEHRSDWCRCDPSVGMSPCEYCAISSALERTSKLLRHIIEAQSNE